MKRSEPSGRLHWPRDGAAIRVPPRRIAMRGPNASMNAATNADASLAPMCEVIAFAGTHAQPARAVAWNALATALPRGTRVVLLVAAEDVSFTTADVPALSGMRLREALPNLVEEKIVGDVGALHVALGETIENEGGSDRGGRTLAMIDRHWLAAMQVDVVRAGHRVATIIPESLAVPLADGAWSLAGAGVPARLWLRNASQQAIPLSDDMASAVATAAALARPSTGAARPRQLDLYATPAAKAAVMAVAEAAAASLAATLHYAGGDPFIEWLARRGHEGAYGAPMSMLAFDRAEGAAAWTRWRIAALLVFAILAVQIIGMQWQWAGQKREANALRADEIRVLTSAFPDTRVVLDAPLQMSRGLSALRASSGRSDPADFSMMMAASARIFADLPSNALRGADYEARALRLRLAPGMASASEERERLIAQAAQAGYVLRFETTGTQTAGAAQGAASSSSGEAIAVLKTRGGG